MAVLEAGRPAPEFSLAHYDGERFTRADLEGQTTVLVFYPFAFSEVCTDQFNVYEEVKDEFAARGATLYGVSCDGVWAQQAFREQLGVEIEQLSDFEPKGATCRDSRPGPPPPSFHSPGMTVRRSHARTCSGAPPCWSSTRSRSRRGAPSSW